MASDPLTAYKSTRIETASREQILLMLYEGAIKFMKQARQGLVDKDYQLGHQKLLKAQDIITELMASLDMEVGGEIASNLYSLYDYILYNLVQANVEKSPQRIDDALPVMRQLESAWNEIINEQGMTVEKAKAEARKNKLSGTKPGPSPLSQNPDKGKKFSPRPEAGKKKNESASKNEDNYGSISFQG
ncbi:MAG: flagellar export chaperone FliS [bacterium]